MKNWTLDIFWNMNLLLFTSIFVTSVAEGMEPREPSDSKPNAFAEVGNFWAFVFDLRAKVCRYIFSIYFLF